MMLRSSSPRVRDGSERLTLMERPLIYQDGVLPDDFVRRLSRFRQAIGLSWNGLAEALGVDPKQVLRWRHGVEPCGGAMLAIVRLASQVPGGIQLIMGDDFSSSLWRP